MKPLEPSSLLSLQLEPITRHVNRVMVVNKFVFIDIDRMIYCCKYNKNALLQCIFFNEYF